MYPFHQQFLLCCGFFLYLPASAAGVLHLLRRGTGSERAAAVLAVGAVLSHAAFLVARGLETGAFPVRTGLESLILFLVALTALVMVLGRVFQTPTVLSFALPVVTAITAGSFLLVRPPADPVGPNPLLLAFHISLMIISYAAFALGFLTGAMYILQERQLKSRRPGRLLYLLPSLDVMEQASAWAISVGYALLTVGILLGAAGLRAAPERLAGNEGWLADPKVLWTGLTWATYTGVVLLRGVPRFRGRRVAMVTVLGFGFVIFTYFGANLLGAGFHRF